MFTNEDVQQLSRRGITVEQATEQLRQLREGFPPLDIIAPASAKNGILRLSKEEQDECISLWKSYLAEKHDVVKFVPASGAASRMFKDLFAYLDSGEETPAASEFLAALPKEPENALPITRDAIAKHVEWEVIDGQQRLTTIHILLSVLDLRQELEAKFSIRYATREDSQSFLEGIAKKNEEDSLNDIDFWHMFEAYKEIQDWFSTISEKSKGRWSEDLFKEVLLNKVQFIWYESNEDPIKVFTRLNIGKIGLTNSELIKALMLNRSNFEGQDADKIRLRQLEIAVKWDEIESVLQDDEFWMFLHDKGFDKPTRIDFLFDLVCELKMLDRYIDESALEDKDGLLGKDGYRTFRYFNAYFKKRQYKI